MIIEQCIEKIEKHNHRNSNKVMFVNLNNRKDLSLIKEHFSFGCDFVKITSEDKTDNIPVFDEILNIIELNKTNAFIEGISAYLRLLGQKQLEMILTQLINISIESNAVVLLYQCDDILHNIISKDPRLDSRVIFVEGEKQPLPKITFITNKLSKSVGQNAHVGIDALISNIELSEERLYVCTRFSKDDFPESLYSINELTSYFEIAKLDYLPTLSHNDESFLSQEQWLSIVTKCQEYGNIENYFHSEIGEISSIDMCIKSWTNIGDDKKALVFIMLKTHNSYCKNKYMRNTVVNCNSIDDLLVDIYRYILQIDNRSSDYWDLYNERKEIISSLGANEHVANIFCDYAESFGEKALYVLTDLTLAERKTTIKLISETHEQLSRKSLMDILKHTYSDLYLYLSKYEYGIQEISSYFNEYKYLKVINHITDEFEEIVKKEGKERNFNRLLPMRSEKTHALDKNNAILYFVDALGVEYMSYITQKASEKHMMVHSTICRSDLPTITSQNKEFIELFKLAGAAVVDNIKELDEIKHSGSLDYDYTKSKYPTYLADELDVLNSVLDKIDSKLGISYDRAYIISDHGASRLSVIGGNQTKWEMVNKGEHCGRCCKISEQVIDEPNEYMTEENGYWVLANYDMIKGGRPGTVEVHGGATLEEVCIPILEFTRMPKNISIDVITKTVEIGYKVKPIVKFISNCKLNNVTVSIGDKFFDAVSDDGKHFSVELTGYRLEKEYLFNVYSDNSLICKDLKFKLKSVGFADNDIL